MWDMKESAKIFPVLIKHKLPLIYRSLDKLYDEIHDIFSNFLFSLWKKLFYLYRKYESIVFLILRRW